MEHNYLTSSSAHQQDSTDLMLNELIQMNPSTDDFGLSTDQFVLFDSTNEQRNDQQTFCSNSFENNNPFSVDRSLDDFLTNVENENLE